jgi:hypothetical protein
MKVAVVKRNFMMMIMMGWVVEKGKSAVGNSMV